jgi:hypothetical protein
VIEDAGVADRVRLEDDGDRAAQADAEDERASVEVVSRSADALELVTRGSRPAWLVWSQSFSPGWRAHLDARELRVWRANYLLQAVAVPAGVSRVRWRYSEPALGHGALGAGLAVGVCCVFAWLDRRRRAAAGRVASGRTS